VDLTTTIACVDKIFPILTVDKSLNRAVSNNILFVASEQTSGCHLFRAYMFVAV
jgi:hypothetical protein